MSTKHTPGPWSAAPFQTGTLNMRTGEQGAMRHGGYAITALEPRMFGGTRVVQAEMSEGDARLIAEAPAMLEALEACFIALGRLGANFDTKMVGRAEWERARAILARLGVI